MKNNNNIRKQLNSKITKIYKKFIIGKWIIGILLESWKQLIYLKTINFNLYCPTSFNNLLLFIEKLITLTCVLGFYFLLTFTYFLSLYFQDLRFPLPILPIVFLSDYPFICPYLRFLSHLVGSFKSAKSLSIAWDWSMKSWRQIMSRIAALEFRNPGKNVFNVCNQQAQVCMKCESMNPWNVQRMVLDTHIQRAPNEALDARIKLCYQSSMWPALSNQPSTVATMCHHLNMEGHHIVARL